MDKIFNNFLETNLIKEYSTNYDIIYIDLVGSRRTGVLDEVSDYDIQIMVIDKNASNLQNYYKDHLLEGPYGERVHWYLHDFQEVVNGSVYYYFV